MTEITPLSAEVTQANHMPLDPTEVNLSTEIEQLWQVHSKALTSLSRSRAEVKVARDDLSRTLHELKAVLRPGRGGAWSSFLETQKIPRSTADRLVRGHEKKLDLEGNCAAEQIVEPTEVIVRRYLQGLWPRLSKGSYDPRGRRSLHRRIEPSGERSLNENPKLRALPFLRALPLFRGLSSES